MNCQFSFALKLALSSSQELLVNSFASFWTRLGASWKPTGPVLEALESPSSHLGSSLDCPKEVLCVDNVLSGTEITDFWCRFGPPIQNTFGLGRSRNYIFGGESIYRNLLLNLLSKMKAVRRQCIALSSGEWNVFAHRELLEHTIDYSSFCSSSCVPNLG